MAVDDEQELQCATDFRQPAIHLSPELLKRSTAELFAARKLEHKNPNDIRNHTGEWAHLRVRLDYSYHKVPNKFRQLLQDSIIQSVLDERSEECKACSENHAHPQALFTAGAMASGKGHTLRYFLKEGKVALPKDFIWVDPDKISRQLPERKQYIEDDQDKAPERLHPEASMLQEILGLVARERRQSLVVDGSLSDGDWFKKLMASYRDDGYVLEIFFVFADEDIMEERAKEREKETGRQTDRAHIQDSARRAPQSVQELAHHDNVHRVRLIDNSSNEKPPRLVYDSQGDACFEKEGKSVDVMKWVKQAQSTH